MKLLLSTLLLATWFLATFLVPGAFAQAAPIDITAQKLEVNQATSQATFSGDVVVVQQDLTLTAPQVIANYTSGGTGSGIQTVTATGGVTITRNGANGITEKAVGTTAIYNPQGGSLVLTGAVTLTRGPSQLSGDKLVYNLQTGNAVVTNSQGPVKARFVPGK